MTGREQADADWMNETAHYHGVGSIAADRPELVHGRVFYTTSLGCDATPEREAFCAEYNRRLEELVREHGIPPWAPANRIPGREESLEALRTGHADLESMSLGPQERRGLRRMIELREDQRISNTRIVVDVTRGIALVGGDVGARAGAVDIVDLESGRYMRRYEYRRRHCPTFPW